MNFLSDLEALYLLYRLRKRTQSPKSVQVTDLAIARLERVVHVSRSHGPRAA